MSATVAGFKSAFSEFAGKADAEIAARLAMVELRVSSDWGTWRDEVVYLELADSLAGTPGGRRARKVDDGKGRNIYHEKLNQLKETFALTRRTGTP